MSGLQIYQIDRNKKRMKVENDNGRDSNKIKMEQESRRGPWVKRRTRKQKRTMGKTANKKEKGSKDGDEANVMNDPSSEVCLVYYKSCVHPFFRVLFLSVG